MKRIILAVDPGKATGISCFGWDSKAGEEPHMIMAGEYQPNEFAAPIRQIIASAQEEQVHIEIVCERFTINAQTVRNTQAPYSLEQIGVLKQIMRDYGIDENLLKFQSPADAKRMFPNEGIKKLGYWHKGGEGHAIDAIRHGLLHLAKNGWTPLRLLQ
jgi:hypothetical protein